MKIIFGFVFLAFFFIPGVTLGITPEWIEIYGESGTDYCDGMDLTTDGGYILSGTTNGLGSGVQIYLVKTDSLGVEQWSSGYGGSSSEGGLTVCQTTDGGYLVGGYTYSYGAGLADAFLVKTDGSGNQLWTATFGGTSYDYCLDVQQTADGGFILAGYTKSYGTGDYDAWLIKTDEFGVEQWSNTFGGSADDGVESVKETIDGGYVLCGYTESYGSGGEDAWLIKTDSSGNEQWNHTYGSSGDDYATWVEQTSSSGYILCGRSDSYSAVDDAYAVLTDIAGNELWHKNYGYSSFDYFQSCVQTGDYGFFFTGHTYTGSDSLYNAYFVRTDGDGFIEWSASLGGTDYDYTLETRLTADGGYIVSGWTRSYSPGIADLWLIKLPQVITTIEDYTIDISTDHGLGQNYPNPFSEFTSISYSISGTARVQLSVYDMSGRLVYTLVNEVQPGGDHMVNFVEDLSDGIYVYRLTVDGEPVESRFMVVVK